MNLSKFNIQEVALIHAWAEQSNGTNWFFYIDSKDDTHETDEDTIESVVNKAHKGLVKLIKLGVGYVVEFAPKVVAALSHPYTDLDDDSVLEGIVAELKKNNSLGTFIIGWSTTTEPYMRGNEEIKRYRGSLERHKKILQDAGYTYYPEDCTLMESNDGVLVPIVKLDPSDEDLAGHDETMESVITKLSDAYEGSTEESIKF